MAAKEGLEQMIRQALASHTARRISLSLEESAALAKAASEAALRYEVPIVFSLVDAVGQQRYFFSMDSALLISHTLAPEKAWTAVALRMATHELAELVQPGAALAGLEHEKGLCTLGGGLPCWSEGRLLGAIGISGGSVEQDIAIAREALARFSEAHFLLTSSR